MEQYVGLDAMEFYAALDAPLEKNAVCILDRDGQMVLETVIASEPDALAIRLAPTAASSYALDWKQGRSRSGSFVASPGMAWSPS